MSTAPILPDKAKPGQLTAMISSTAVDLPEHRAAVKEACLSCGIFPIGMEALPARDATGITVSLEMVDKADLYLGIYAFRYGWVPDGKDISITEMEFDHAVERQKQGHLHELLIFTAHDDHPCTKKDIETGDVPQQKLTLFKARASTGRVRKEFKSVEELRRLVSDALHQFKARQRLPVTAPPIDPSVPATQLGSFPRLQPFFGREDESKNITDALDPKPSSYDFFISYTGKDEAWGEWLAWQMREQGYTFRFQKWHFRPGNSWVAEMQKALQQCKRMIAVLSPDYLKSRHGQAEWNVFYAKDPDGSKTLLIPVRVAKVELTDLHSTRNYIDFVDKPEAKCLEALLHGLKPMAATSIPAFPGSLIVPPPSFPSGNNSSPTTPNNLPRPQCFFGRTTERKRIADALSPERRIWGVLIHGPGGIGKTSLAIQAALDAPHGSFTRKVFLSAKQRDMTADGPRALSDFTVPTCLDMLNEIARLHGLGHLANAPEADRIRLISEALAHERTLFVLDNLETLSAMDAERLFAFINRLPESCKAIVTSRPRPGDEGCIIDLRKLHKTAAMKYLAELATDRPILKKSHVSQREKLYEETGGNPLLMRWVVGQLGRGNCQTLAKAIKFLREAPDDNDPLKFIFEDMAGDLSKSEIKAIHGLSGTPGPLDVRALAKQAKLTVNAATTVLSDLADRGLVNADPLRETFSVLPIVVSYLKKSKRTQSSSPKLQA